MLTETDKREVLDLVERKESITYRQIREQTPMYTPDEIWEALQWGREQGIVVRREGNIHEDGTTEGIWEWNDD